MIKRTFKAHPIMIISLMKPYLFVLVLPLIRALIQFIVTKQINGLLSLEIIAFFFVLAVAILSYRAISITVSDRYLTVKKGVLIKSCAIIELSRLSSVGLSRNPLDFLFGSVLCAVNTEAGKPKESDFAFKMYSKDAERLFEMIYGDTKRVVVKFSPTKIALLAATTSSAFSGMVIGVPVINQLGDLLGVALSDMFLNEINNISSKLDKFFPPIINTVSLVMLAAYLVSFFATFLKNINFKLQSNNESIEIKSGLIVRRHIVFKKSKVNNICIEQTPLMHLFKRFSMRASIGGYGDGQGEKSVVIPVATHDGLEAELKKQFPLFAEIDSFIQPSRTKVERNRFFFMPLIWLALIVSASIVAALAFEHFTNLLLFILAVLLCLDLYYAYVCYRNYKFSRLSFSQGVFASGTRGFNSRELYCNKSNIGIIKISQTPADRRYKTCKIKFTVRSEKADSIRVKNLNFNVVLREIERAFNIEKLYFNE